MNHRKEQNAMKIIISPAKKMVVDTDSFPVSDKPIFLQETELLMKEMKKCSLEEAKAVWKCNDKLTSLNYQRFQTMDLYNNLTPAILAYEGLQYQHMAPAVFTADALTYVSHHLRILSGFYGVLRPFDGVTPYRLEMQAKLPVQGKKNLYEFWGKKLYDEISKDGLILNLASKEYSQYIEKYVQSPVQFINVEFLERVEGKLKQKGTLAKMARGEMVRFLAEHQIKEPEGMKEFKELGFSFAPELSEEKNYVFVCS